MAQRNSTSLRKDSAPEQRTNSEPNSRPQLPPSISTQSNDRVCSGRPRQLTLPITGYPQSLAERYIAARAQIGSNPEDLSPATPSSASSSSGSSQVYAFEPAGGHHALMHQWHQQKTHEVQRKEKHRYVYGQPPPVERSGQHGTLQSRLIAATQPRHDPPAPSSAETQATVQPSEKRLSKASTDV